VLVIYNQMSTDKLPPNSPKLNQKEHNSANICKKATFVKNQLDVSEAHH